MKRLKKHRTKSVIRNLRIGNYLRQFSIVTGGIIITFWGSSLISERARKKEVHETMQLVAKELQHNSENLQGVKRMIDKDIHLSSLLIENNFNLEYIVADTIKKYGALFNNLTSFEYSDDALEVMKGSALMQYIPDKQILQDILQAYQNLDQIQKGINRYYTLKKDILYELAFSRNKEIAKSLKPDNDSYIQYLTKNPSFITYVMAVPTFTDWSELETLDTRLNDLIGECKLNCVR